ncbi:MAG: patatin-like phospholipase family protein [Pseudonocardia sp.]|nr:patatin-like phospholipase family protein [Pseudonocardia sp.]
MTVAFVLSGGGSLGAVQVGMLRALTEAGIVADLLVGTSAGALNAAFVAVHGTDPTALDTLERQWIRTRRRDVFPVAPRHQLRALIGTAPSLFSNDRLRHIVERHLAGVRLEDTAIPLRIVTADLLSGQEVVLDSGDAVSAILASAAIPGLFPSVAHQGYHALVDGGLADNTAVSVAVAAGADHVIVLPTGYPCALTTTPRSAVGISLQALNILIQQRLIADMARMRERAHIATLPPLCPLSVSPLDFGKAAELIEHSYRDSTHWIAQGGLDLGRPEQYLSLHHHA